jgi:hypothetical protein
MTLWNWSTVAFQVGGTTIVVSGASIKAGPETRSPGDSASRA